MGLVTEADTVTVEDDHEPEMQPTTFGLEAEGTVGGGKQTIDEEFGMESPSGNQGVGSGEDDVIVGNGQEMAAEAVSPLMLDRGGTFGATTLVAGIIEDELSAAGVTGEDTAAELRGTTDGNALEDRLTPAIMGRDLCRGRSEEDFGQLGITHALEDGRKWIDDSNEEK